MSPTVRLDLHVHSRHSPDSTQSLDTIAGRVAALGLEGFAVTDHNSIAGHADIPTLRRQFPALIIVPGVEVSTREGHLLAYGVDAAPPRDRPVRETIDWVRSRRGVPVLAHPFRFWHGVGGEIGRTAAVPALEAVNGHSSSAANRRAQVVAAGRRIGTTGGSDAHRPEDVGRSWTEIDLAETSVAPVLAALAAGTARGAGRSATRGEWARLAFASAGRRLRRGLRPV